MMRAYMTEQQRLVQRFIDEELTAAERIALLVRLGREQALREDVLELERLQLHVSRLERPVVPSGFVEQVMERIEPRPAAWRRLLSGLWQPRTLRWNFAGALAAAVVLVSVGGGVAAPCRAFVRVHDDPACRRQGRPRPRRRPLAPRFSSGWSSCSRMHGRLTSLETSTDGTQHALRWSPRRTAPGQSPSPFSPDDTSTCSSSTARSGSVTRLPSRTRMMASDRGTQCWTCGRERRHRCDVVRDTAE